MQSAEVDQATLWKGQAGRAWVESQELLDQIFKPFEDLLVKQIGATSCCRLLDVGCGTGSTTLALARQLQAKGCCCTGIDISDAMIAAARGRAEREGTPLAFICDNAQDYAFEPARFDGIVSRFGVMFFTHPVQAFANLRRSAREGAELRLVAWRSPEENPFMTEAERVAAPLLPELLARKANAPGQFAFANRDRVYSILEQSNWSEVAIRPVDVACSMPEKELHRYLTQIGPVGRALQRRDQETHTRVMEIVRPAFDHYVHGTEIHFTAACWLISAEASPSPAAD